MDCCDCPLGRNHSSALVVRVPETHKISPEISNPSSIRRLKFWVWFKERVHSTELQVPLLRTAIICFLGVSYSIAFRVATGFVHNALAEVRLDSYLIPCSDVSAFQHLSFSAFFFAWPQRSRNRALRDRFIRSHQEPRLVQELRNAGCSLRQFLAQAWRSLTALSSMSHCLLCKLS